MDAGGFVMNNRVNGVYTYGVLHETKNSNATPCRRIGCHPFIG
jgi:hypothetical protein